MSFKRWQSWFQKKYIYISHGTRVLKTKFTNSFKSSHKHLTYKPKPNTKQICEPLTCKPKPNKRAITLSWSEPANPNPTNAPPSHLDWNLQTQSQQTHHHLISIETEPQPKPITFWFMVLTKRDKKWDRARENHLCGGPIQAWSREKAREKKKLLFKFF